MATNLPIFDSSKINTTTTVAIPTPVPSTINTVASSVSNTFRTTVSSVSNVGSNIASTLSSTFSSTRPSTTVQPTQPLPEFNQTFSSPPSSVFSTSTTTRPQEPLGTTFSTLNNPLTFNSTLERTSVSLPSQVTTPATPNFLSTGTDFLSNRTDEFKIPITSAPTFGGTISTAPNLALTPKINFNLESALQNPSGIRLSNIVTGIPTTGAGLANALGVPTTIGGALAAAGIPTALPPLNQALNTLGVPTNFRGLVNLTGLKFPKIPGFPGIDLIGINLGAGVKWIAEQIAKYKLIVPPFIPGLKINMAVALAAVSVIRSAIQVGPGELLKHLLSSIVDDLKQEVISQVQTQLNEALKPASTENIKVNLGGVVDGAKESFVSNYNLLNPPKTTTNEDGETITIPPPPPDISAFPKIELPPVKVGLTESTSISQFSGTPPLSQAKAFSFSPENSTPASSAETNTPGSRTTPFSFSPGNTTPAPVTTSAPASTTSTFFPPSTSTVSVSSLAVTVTPPTFGSSISSTITNKFSPSIKFPPRG